MANREEAINCIQDLIDVANFRGSAYVHKHNGGVERLKNVLACLTEEQCPIIQTERITLRNIMGEFHAKVVEPTAEEMFRVAGYHLDYSNRMQTLYRKDVDPEYYIELDTHGCYKGYASDATLAMSWPEMAACLRWKQEQEAAHAE